MRFSEINKPKLNEDVGGNYLYHATGGLKKILSTGRIFPAHGPQDATKAQTTLPTVSTTRDWNYASGGESETEGVDSNAVIVLDRNAVESNFKTLGTSQSRDVRGLAHPQQTNLDAVKTARSYDVDNNKVLNKKDADELFAKGSILGRDGKPVSREVVGRTAGAAKQGFYSSKAGGEFEEAIVVPETGLPIARTMFGFWVNPQSQLTKDPEVMNDPRRLELAPGGTGRFVKAKQQQGVSEDANPKRQAAIAIAMKKAGKKPKSVLENDTAAGINKMFNNLGDPVFSNLQRVALLAMQGRQQEASGRLQSVIKDASPAVQKKIIDAVNNIKPVTINGKIADSSTIDKSKSHQDWILNTFIPWVQSLLDQQGVAEGSGGNWYIRVNGKILNDTKFKPMIFSSEDEARSYAMKLADKKRIPLSQIKLTKSWMDAPEQGVAEGKLIESAVFLNPTTVIVGQAHGQPLELSPNTLKQIQAIATKHGAWYEGNGTDRGYTKGQIDRYVGSWDDEVAKTASPNDPKWLYVLFANVDANNRVQRVGVDSKDTIFNRLLATAKDNSFQGIGYTSQALQKFLQMSSEGKYDFVKMSQQPATQENLTRFLKAGEALMWPSNWEQYPNKAGKIAKAATVDVRDQYLATRKAGVYVTGSGHLKAVQNITGKQGVAEGLPGSLSKSDYTPSATVKNPNTSCKRCNGRGTLWKAPDGKILPANDVPGAKKYKCGACDGIGMAKKEVDEGTEKECPPATQDIQLNLKNRQKAINEYGYGPLNPDMPNTKFWMKKVDEWNLDSVEEAQQSLCGNCAAFDQRADTLDCIAQGIDSDQGEEDPTIEAGDLGYCRFLKFKCASRRTCDAWVTGGPLTDDKKEVDEGENWSKHNNKRAGGMSKKSVSVYRREHPGSKIQTAVTTKPSKLKKGSKAAKRRASFCARMRGMKKHRTGAKTAHDPNSNINKSLRRWHCESIEELHELVMIAEQFIRNNKK